jgi:hypothetical protein
MTELRNRCTPPRTTHGGCSRDRRLCLAFRRYVLELREQHPDMEAAGNVTAAAEKLGVSRGKLLRHRRRAKKA